MTDYRVRIDYDEEYNDRPGDFVAYETEAENREYVAQFERGELTAYGVMIERRCDAGAWHVEDSVWGVDIEQANQEGIYDSPAELQHEYLRQLAEEMWPEAVAA